MPVSPVSVIKTPTFAEPSRCFSTRTRQIQVRLGTRFTHVPAGPIPPPLQCRHALRLCSKKKGAKVKINQFIPVLSRYLGAAGNNQD